MVLPSEVRTGFGDIGGVAAVKAALHELVIYPLLHPELFQSGQLKRGVKVRKRLRGREGSREAGQGGRGG